MSLVTPCRMHRLLGVGKGGKGGGVGNRRNCGARPLFFVCVDGGREGIWVGGLLLISCGGGDGGNGRGDADGGHDDGTDDDAPDYWELMTMLLVIAILIVVLMVMVVMIVMMNDDDPHLLPRSRSLSTYHPAPPPPPQLIEAVIHMQVHLTCRS